MEKIFLEDTKVKNGMFKGWYVRKNVTTDYTTYRIFITGGEDIHGPELFGFDFKHFNKVDITEDELITACAETIAKHGVNTMLEKTYFAFGQKSEATIDSILSTYEKSVTKFCYLPEEFVLDDNAMKLVYSALKKETQHAIETKLEPEKFGTFIDTAIFYEEKLSNHIDAIRERYDDRIAAKEKLDEIFSK